MQIDIVFQIVILIFSVVIHEVSHGYAAYFLGDNTAKYQGRLNLNPLNHLELFGSFILPVITYMSGGLIIGWAKPVPFNPYNLRDQKWGEAKVAIAGPLSNIFIALVFGLLIRFGIAMQFGQAFIYISSVIVLINLMLAVFNLVPIPPLDGSKVLFSLLPYNMNYVREFLEKNGIYLMLFFIFFLWKFIYTIVSLGFSLITGFSI
jgi:Zn-dependent protease